MQNAAGECQPMEESARPVRLSIGRSRPRSRSGVRPLVLQRGGLRFLIFSREGSEPPHVHVRRGGARAKFWLEPVRLIYFPAIEEYASVFSVVHPELTVLPAPLRRASK